MPILERDPWRDQYFAGVACPEHVAVPTDDADAYAFHTAHRHIYDKLRVARSQGVACDVADALPPAFPVFVKPRFNMKGMAVASGRADDAETFRRLAGDGMMWAELASGPHWSSDFAVEDGVVRWRRHAHGVAREGGMFRHWIVGARPPDRLEARLEAWIASEAAGYTGMLNIETLGGTIIEAHLRFSDQWPDLYGGEAWAEAVVGLYDGRGWRFAGDPPTGYSAPLFMAHGRRHRHPPAQLQERVRAMPGLRSLQITFHEDRDPADHPMPPGGFRVAVVNGDDLAACYRARDLLWSAWFASSPALF